MIKPLFAQSAICSRMAAISHYIWCASHDAGGCKSRVLRHSPSISETEMQSTEQLMVTKRDGRTEPINLDKIHRVVDWAAEGLNNVSVSQVELRSHIQFYEGI